jgi:hypothetical protein
MKRLLAAMGRVGRGVEERAQQWRFGPLTKDELLGRAAGPMDAGILRVAVHVMRAEGARAQKSLATAGTRGLTNEQRREEGGAMGAVERIEGALLELVTEANRRANAAQ